ncbi:MAG: hypothetical protein HY600_02900, partial [Candidatus Omnitrophica bacterium]|nr:hypothetical protein [Candidatus Omnitrophota bacterium]
VTKITPSGSTTLSGDDVYGGPVSQTRSVTGMVMENGRIKHRTETLAVSAHPVEGGSTSTSSTTVTDFDDVGRPFKATETLTQQTIEGYDGTHLTLLPTPLEHRRDLNEPTGFAPAKPETISSFGELIVGAKKGWGLTGMQGRGVAYLSGDDLFGGRVIQIRQSRPTAAGGFVTSRQDTLEAITQPIEGGETYTKTGTLTTFGSGVPEQSFETIQAQYVLSYDGTELGWNGKEGAARRGDPANFQTTAKTISTFNLLIPVPGSPLKRTGWGLILMAVEGSTTLKGTDLFGGTITQTRTVVPNPTPTQFEHLKVEFGRVVKRTETLLVEGDPIEGGRTEAATRTVTLFDPLGRPTEAAETLERQYLLSYDGTELGWDGQGTNTVPGSTLKRFDSSATTISRFNTVTVTRLGITRTGWALAPRTDAAGQTLAAMEVSGNTILRGADLFGGPVTQTRTAIQNSPATPDALKVEFGRVVKRTEDLRVETAPIEGGAADTTTRTATFFNEKGQPTRAEETVMAQTITSYDGTRLTLQSPGDPAKAKTVSHFGPIEGIKSPAVPAKGHPIRAGWGLTSITPGAPVVLTGDDLFGGKVTQTRTVTVVEVAAGRVGQRTETLAVHAEPIEGGSSDTTTSTVTEFNAKGQPFKATETLTQQHVISFDGTDLTLREATVEDYIALQMDLSAGVVALPQTISEFGELTVARPGWGLKGVQAKGVAVLSGTDFFGGEVLQGRRVTQVDVVGGFVSRRDEQLAVKTAPIEGGETFTKTRTVTTFKHGAPSESRESTLFQYVRSFDGTELGWNGATRGAASQFQSDAETVSIFGPLLATPGGPITRNGHGLLRVDVTGSTTLTGKDLFGGTVKQIRQLDHLKVEFGRVVKRTETLTVEAGPVEGGRTVTATKTITNFDPQGRPHDATETITTQYVLSYDGTMLGEQPGEVVKLPDGRRWFESDAQTISHFGPLGVKGWGLTSMEASGRTILRGADLFSNIISQTRTVVSEALKVVNGRVAERTETLRVETEPVEGGATDTTTKTVTTFDGKGRPATAEETVLASTLHSYDGTWLALEAPADTTAKTISRFWTLSIGGRIGWGLAERPVDEKNPTGPKLPAMTVSGATTLRGTDLFTGKVAQTRTVTAIEVTAGRVSQRAETLAVHAEPVEGGHSDTVTKT